MSTKEEQIATLTARAVESIRLERWDAAEHAAVQILHADRRNAEGQHLMGMVRARQGQVLEAERFYRRSLALRPKQAYVHINLARLLAHTGRVQDAITHLRGAIRDDRDSPDLYLLLGQLQQGAGDPVYAEKNLRAALELRPNDPMALQCLAGVLASTGRSPEAEALIGAALERHPPPSIRTALESLLESLKAPPG
jgi:predicted Zn-dependent protease